MGAARREGEMLDGFVSVMGVFMCTRFGASRKACSARSISLDLGRRSERERAVTRHPRASGSLVVMRMLLWRPWVDMAGI